MPALVAPGCWVCLPTTVSFLKLPAVQNPAEGRHGAAGEARRGPLGSCFPQPPAGPAVAGLSRLRGYRHHVQEAPAGFTLGTTMVCAALQGPGCQAAGKRQRAQPVGGSLWRAAGGGKGGHETRAESRVKGRGKEGCRHCMSVEGAAEPSMRPAGLCLRCPAPQCMHTRLGSEVAWYGGALRAACVILAFIPSLYYLA